jgi:pyruvate dehydrogenase (quinone)
VAIDSDSATSWWAQHLKPPPGVRASLAGTLVTTDIGTPYATGAKFAYPMIGPARTTHTK